MGRGARHLGIAGTGQEDLKLGSLGSLGLPLRRLSQAGALLQTTQAHAEIISLVLQCNRQHMGPGATLR